MKSDSLSDKTFSGHLTLSLAGDSLRHFFAAFANKEPFSDDSTLSYLNSEAAEMNENLSMTSLLVCGRSLATYIKQD